MKSRRPFGNAASDHSSRTLTAVLAGIFAGILLVVSFAGSCAAASSVTQKQNELKSVQSEMEKRKSNIFQFKTQEKSVLKQLLGNERDLETTRVRLTDLQRQRGRTEDGIAQSAAELRLAMAELAKAEARLKGQVDVLKKRLRAMYVRGPGDYLELILTSADFTDFVTRFDLLERIVKQDVELFDRVKREKEAVDQRRSKIEERKALLQKRRAVLTQIEGNVAREQARIAGKAREREGLLDEIRSKKELEEQALDELERTARELDSMIAKLLSKSKTKVIASDTGRMSWPVSGIITSPYGSRMHPILRTRRFHSGIDIAASSGTSVVAARSGVVIFSGWYGGYGKLVIIDHGAGISTAYAHNSTLLVSSGSKVIRGQKIARVGSTGLSTGPHLHFEVRVSGGGTQNPMDWLK